MTSPTAVIPLPDAADGAHRHAARLRRLALWLITSLLATLLSACWDDGRDAEVLAATAPAVVTPPASVTVKSGAAASFSVTVTGTAPITYQWRRNGSDIAGASDSTYRIATTSAADSGAQFSVVVGNAAGSVTSAAATLSVDSGVAPALTAPPVAQTVTVGMTATFSVTATGSDPLQYQWKRNGVDIAGATAASHTTAATTAADDGATFAVTVSNAAGSATSDAARLTVTPATVPASVTTPPAATTVTAGQTATFTVAAAGTAPLGYQWRRNGVDIAGATAASYTTGITVAADDGAKFSVVVNNAANAPVTSAEAVLTVGTADVAVQITAQPGNVSVTAGQAASFTVVAVGTAPRYQWQRDGAPLAGATSPTYTVANTTVADSGARFSVVVGNAVNSVTSSIATLTVGAATIAPSVTTQPADQSVTAPATASFTVATTGTAPFTYQWRRNGTAIAGATAAVYTTPATATADDGALYSVVVVNSAGSATSRDARLTVADAVLAPSLTTQPADATAAVGQTATFAVVAAGTGPLSYQWRRNGIAITGATAASYTTPAVATADNGAVFTVVVSNSGGAITSRAAVLGVSVAASPLTGRAWTAGQVADQSQLITAGASVIDDQGRVTVLYSKFVSDRLVLQAVRGAPGASGSAPVFGTPVALETGTVGDPAVVQGLAVSPAGNLWAAWTHNETCGSTPCSNLYAARYLASTGRWEARALVASSSVPSALGINDSGDVMLLAGSTVYWRADGASAFGSQAWPLVVDAGVDSTAFVPSRATLDGAGRIVVAGSLYTALTRSYDIAVHRGDVRAGMGAREIVDVRGASATLNALFSNPAGQSVLLWSQDNGVRPTVFAATVDAPGSAWAITDTGQTPPLSGATIPAALGDDGNFIWYFYGNCAVQRRTAGTWFGATSLPATLCQATGIAGTPTVARNGNLVTLHPTDGSWLAYDAQFNQVFNPLPHAASGAGYLLGFAKPLSALPGSLLLASNGTGAYVSTNSFGALPTASQPNGDSGVPHLWAWYFR